MTVEVCQYHMELDQKLTRIETGVEYLKKDAEADRARIRKHVDEGEKEGGFRDRLQVLEQSVSSLKKAEWKRVIVSGIVGGLIGSNAPGAFELIMKIISKVCFAGQ